MPDEKAHAVDDSVLDEEPRSGGWAWVVKNSRLVVGGMVVVGGLVAYGLWKIVEAEERAG
jgi:cytochrome c-type biogenesis protein CcmH/NrfG